MASKYPDKKAFKEVCASLEAGNSLSFEQIGSIFGQEFWMMLVISLMDSADAARAIQGAINRLRMAEEEGRRVN